jgi:lipopolysaccharide transport system ATP-binding protein
MSGQTVAVELRNAGKRYTKYEDTPLLVTSALRLRPRTRRKKLWAVRGVDLQVADGESFGIIGRNGSGKSTTMMMMAGITAPSEGSVRVWGRVAPLIQVGVGFHRELTGRENIYVNGAILGLSRRQIDQRLDAIVDFAEIASFIDTPVKFYSSGMFVRLGFSVAVHAEPDVLLVDEVLAVGDLAFQVKCFERMNEIRARGATVILVTHHFGAVRRMCERVLLLHQGRPVMTGGPEEAIAASHELMRSAAEVIEDRDSGARYEPGVVEILGSDLLGPDGRPTGAVTAGDEVSLRLRVEALTDVEQAVVAITLFGPDGTVVYADSNATDPFGPLRAGTEEILTVRFPANLPTGSYAVAGRVDRADLRTLLAQGESLMFFVTGRNTVAGSTDLGAAIERSGPVDEVIGTAR